MQAEFTQPQIGPSRFALDLSRSATLGAAIDTLIIRGDTMKTDRRRGTVSTEILVHTHLP